MTEIKTHPDHPASMQERINKRLRNSGVGMGTQPDLTVQTGNSARRTFHNLHQSADHRPLPVIRESYRTNRETKRLAEVMRTLGWRLAEHTIKVGKKPCRAYYKPQPQDHQ